MSAKVWIREHRPTGHASHSRNAYVNAVNALVAIAGIPWWRAKAIIRWRMRRGFSIHVRRIVEPDGSVTEVGT